MKKVRLRKNDKKMLREVNALSTLSHRFIVRYFTTWIENNDMESNTNSDSDYDRTEDGHTSVPNSGSRRSDLSMGMADLSRPSSDEQTFQNIFFSNGSGDSGSEGSDSDKWEDPPAIETEFFDDGITFDASLARPASPAPVSRTLYIQMVRFFGAIR